MKYTKLTLNQAKMVINEFLLENFGLKAEKLVNAIDKAKDEFDLRNILNEIAKSAPPAPAKELALLWREVAGAIKANKQD